MDLRLDELEGRAGGARRPDENGLRTARCRPAMRGLGAELNRAGLARSFGGTASCEGGDPSHRKYGGRSGPVNP